MVDDYYHSCKFISRPPIGIGVGGIHSAATLCARGHVSRHDTEAEALTTVKSSLSVTISAFPTLALRRDKTNPRDAIIKKIFRSRLAGRHDTWQNQQWERVS